MKETGEECSNLLAIENQNLWIRLEKGVIFLPLKTESEEALREKLLRWRNSSSKLTKEGIEAEEIEGSSRQAVSINLFLFSTNQLSCLNLVMRS